jgi:hypothetical protein
MDDEAALPRVNFELRLAVGEDPRVAELLANIALNWSNAGIAANDA